MRKSDRKAVERLAEALRKAFFERGQIIVDPPELWAAGVMSKIRRIGPSYAPSDFWTLFEKTTWRFIPVAIALILLLGVAFTVIQPEPRNFVADIYNEASLDSGLYAFYDR